mgnify:CR=1 FL=1
MANFRKRLNELLLTWENWTGMSKEFYTSLVTHTQMADSVVKITF